MKTFSFILALVLALVGGAVQAESCESGQLPFAFTVLLPAGEFQARGANTHEACNNLNYELPEGFSTYLEDDGVCQIHYEPPGGESYLFAEASNYGTCEEGEGEPAVPLDAESIGKIIAMMLGVWALGFVAGKSVAWTRGIGNAIG